MKVALVDVDGHHFPNLALAKLARWHKEIGDEVFWYNRKSRDVPDRIYASKVFTFTKDFQERPFDPAPLRGGTGVQGLCDCPSTGG